MKEIIHSTETEYKLNEAKYFATLLSKKNKRGQEFDFLLNAFINSARSVTWVMRAEFSKIDGWETWFKEKKVSKSEDKIFSLFNNLRVNSSKIQSLQTHFLVDVRIPKGTLSKTQENKLEKFKGKKLKISIKNNRGRLPNVKPNAVTFSAYLSSIQRGVVGFTDKDILLLCKEYVSILDKVVYECIAGFGTFVKINNRKSITHQLVKLRY